MLLLYNDLTLAKKLSIRHYLPEDKNKKINYVDNDVPKDMHASEKGITVRKH